MFRKLFGQVMALIEKQKLINKLIKKINQIAVLYNNTPIYILSDSVFFLIL